ncbi:CAAX amino terminal protease self- immunity [Gemmata sp. SH-PL17]|uniref:CPBP family intramembrane glutamic endopeptidase n=1 Tax=Gemmata sp. SH-PL17 TaxID=1630693 RepID=UPI00078C209E|nr:type II CAAX endopeptidase family protein [Gemmata sp. SH-PL17]AMV25892.1 CAAX amino terminal protease self- immunity [Gemmata sp. SH-PL17]
MSELGNDPPLVTRPEPEVAPLVVRRLPKPGFIEAVLWCVIFIATQLLGAIVAVTVAFTAYALAAPDAKAFVDEQFTAFGKSVDLKVEGERPPIPFEFGQALAWGMLAAQVVSLGLILLVVPRRIGPGWKQQIGVRRPYWLHIVLVLLLVPGFIVMSDLIQTVFLTLTGMKPPAAMKALNGVFGQFPWPLTVLAVAIGPGLVEELWCRGFLGRGLCARNGVVVGVLLTSALFSAMHLDPSQLVVIAAMGAYLHFVYLVTRSIWAPILLHAMNNGLAIFLALAMKPGNEQGEIVVPAIVHIAAFGLLVFGSVALWTSRAVPETVWHTKESGSDAFAPPADVTTRYGYAEVSPAALMFSIVSFSTLMYLGYHFSR